ncbi:MAG TPA: glycosyltransferase [Reyranella sp.]|nr:glycosyltransferase [Reyranella sp.]
MNRVLFHVQHLLGIGHVRRAAVLARTLAASGFDVLLVSGGAPLKLDLGRARFHQLPPVRARDEGLRELCQLDGAPLDDAFRADRRRVLLDLLAAERPDIVITEQFPFGRTQLHFELLPLLEAARAMMPKPLIVSSVRDVVRRTARPERIAETLGLLDDFDLVLIHADPRLADFAKSFAGWDGIARRAVYTGYVGESVPATRTQAGAGEVIVSVGGGAVGAPLLKAALGARAASAAAERTWRLLLGDNLADVDRAALPKAAGIVIERARSDFTTLLSNAALSISQAGYNTVVETLCCADRAVLVPFATERETEQNDRARMLAERGMVAMVPADELSAGSLAAAVDRALAGPSIRSFPPCDVRGAAATAELLQARLA